MEQAIVNNTQKFDIEGTVSIMCTDREFTTIFSCQESEQIRIFELDKNQNNGFYKLKQTINELIYDMAYDQDADSLLLAPTYMKINVLRRNNEGQFVTFQQLPSATYQVCTLFTSTGLKMLFSSGQAHKMVDVWQLNTENKKYKKYQVLRGYKHWVTAFEYN